jgi:hypothetical protein
MQSMERKSLGIHQAADPFEPFLDVGFAGSRLMRRYWHMPRSKVVPGAVATNNKERKTNERIL